MNDIQVISKQIGALVSAPGVNTESEQKLITTLADRITFMEMTLYKMDNSVRGHKQLSKSIKQMKDNLLVNGYELVDMLGKDYHEGMKVTANFVEDEELPGRQANNHGHHQASNQLQRQDDSISSNHSKSKHLKIYSTWLKLK